MFPTPKEVFSFKSENLVKARVCHIYDGDTIHLVINYNDNLIKIICRLNGIDTPELSSHDILAIKARNRLVQLVTDWNIDLDNKIGSKTHECTNKIENNTKIIDCLLMGNDKYGRTLVKLFVESKCINDILLDEKLCYEYFGGTKEK
jgi:endonuclease YncB( thermonuclease family)